ncbi:MAG: FlhC family transcriptional regulator, partial [Lamprobacter sp.]|uniref:FlhC family transcriptional regulator n=1 Tax=Lamprobacter sp. TaxID=3100796 RepID=UPI002B260AD3
LFIALYCALGGPETERQIQLEALLQAHRLYREQWDRLGAGGRLGAPIDINAAWVLARDLTTGLTLRRFCRQCHIHYLAADFSRTALQCPICKLKQRSVWRPRGGLRSAKDGEAVEVQPTG